MDDDAPVMPTVMAVVAKGDAVALEVVDAAAGLRPWYDVM